jgi:hypothetical protein
MPPKPSEPASIPTTRKIRSAGIPNLSDALLAMMLSNKRIEPPTSIYSIEII